MSNKQANNNPGLCPIKGQKSGRFSQVRARNQYSGLFLCTTKTTLQYQMLVFYSTFYLSSYILPRDPQERHKSNNPLNRTVPCELVSDFISSHSGMPREPIQPHSLPGRGIVQLLLALSYQGRRCFGNLKRFQSRLTVRANANIFLWSLLSFSFMNTG
jgi:hypothetical protein